MSNKVETEIKTSLNDEKIKLIDDLIVPIVTPNDPNDDNILENLIKTVELELNPPNSVNLMIAVRKTIKNAEKLIQNGSERKEAVLYVCKVAIYKNVDDKLNNFVFLYGEIPNLVGLVFD